VKTAPRPLGSYFRLHLSEERTQETWAKISKRSRGAASRRWALVPALAFSLGVLGFVGVVGLRRSAPHQVPGSGLTVASEAKPRSFEIAGARIELQPFASVTIAAAEPLEQRVEVTRGSVGFHVVHDPSRRFVVGLGAVEIVDVGTEFMVAREGENGELVRVSVESGDVEVRVGSQAPRPLHAGESLTTPQPVVAPPRPEPSAAPPPESSSGVRSIEITSPLEKDKPEPDMAPTAAVAAATGRAVESTRAKSLLAEATAARQAGDPAGEAQALDTLRKRFPHDPRAPIAAFELGILRMDQLGNPRGALETLRAAIVESPGASFREDAEARIVRLLDQLDDAPGCRAARDAFVARYPASVHAASVQRRCPPR